MLDLQYVLGAGPNGHSNAAAAGAFEIRVYFTAGPTLATANPYCIYCDVNSLAAGQSYSCSGNLNTGIYRLVGIAGSNHAVPQSDRSGDLASPTAGVVTVTR